MAEALPAFSIVAAVSGRTLTQADFAKAGVLIVHSAKTAVAAKDVSRAVRAKWANNDAMMLASIVDLRSFAGIWKKVAEAQVKSTYEKLAAKATAAGADPKQEVVIGPDWDGSVCAALGVPKPDEAAQVLVVKGGKITDRLTGADLANRAVAALN